MSANARRIVIVVNGLIEISIFGERNNKFTKVGMMAVTDIRRSRRLEFQPVFRSSERSHAAPRFSNVPPDIRAAPFLISFTWKEGTVGHVIHLFTDICCRGHKRKSRFHKGGTSLLAPR